MAAAGDDCDHCEPCGADEGTRITITFPDDFHHHFRDGDKCPAVLEHATRRFARAIAMPNLKPPVTTTEIATAYHEHLKSCLP
ncbi:hypothetical protein THAOC_11879, partial [Thalassiosira oceanica]